MANNRFDRHTNIRSQYVPREFIPNYDMYAGALSQQQKLYDVAKSVDEKIPQHLIQDANLVNQYRENLSSKVDDLTNIYKDRDWETSYSFCC